MKRFMLLSILILPLLAANSWAGYRSRYQTSYGNWDRTVGSYYSYSETEINTRTTTEVCGRWSNTCYTNITETSTLYIEETSIDQGISTFVVYDSDDYYQSSRIATYYVDHRSGGRHIRRREFHNTRYYHHTHYDSYYYEWPEFDYPPLNTLWLGFEVSVLGASLIAECGESSVCAGVGIALIVAGSVSSAIAAVEHTDLQQQIEANEQSETVGALKGSIDGLESGGKQRVIILSSGQKILLD